MSIGKLTKKRIIDYLGEGKRFDGRKLEEYRKVEISGEVSKNAEGSCKVKLGDTEVIIGVKLEVSEPYPDSADSGTMITTVELLPLASPDFEPGPPKIEAIELARIVDRGVRESGFIDFKKLCIKEGEKVWSVLIDIYPLNDAGNLLDAAALGSVVALKLAKMPKYDEKTERVLYGDWTNKGLPLTNRVPITVTCHKLGNNILVDPIKEEEEASESRLTLAVSDDKEPLIHAGQEGNEDALSVEEISKIIDLSIEKSKLLKKEVDKFFK